LVSSRSLLGANLELTTLPLTRRSPTSCKIPSTMKLVNEQAGSPSPSSFNFSSSSSLLGALPSLLAPLALLLSGQLTPSRFHENSITASRNSDLYQTIYYDPFSPSLFHLSSAAYSDSAAVLPQTLELFGPRLGGGGASDVLKSLFGGRLREVAGWGMEQSIEGRGWVPS
jgi:hypothetical protein